MPSNFHVMLPYLSFTAFVSAVLIVSSPPFFHAEATNGGRFSFDLIHRDSSKSPFYNPLLSTPYERQRNAFQRSKDRINAFASTGVLADGGEYLMKISYGTPPFETLAVVDTGSTLSWTQCLPCKHCFKEKFPLFDPKRSSTFENVSCQAKECEDSPHRTSCDPNSRNCLYRINYGGGFSTAGDLAIDTVTFSGDSDKKNVSIPKFLFGCGNNNSGAVFPDMGSGLVGFGFGNESLVSQLHSLIQGKFSYCLGSFTEVSKSGKLNLGPNDVFSGGGVVSTSVSFNNLFFYTLTLEGISVEDKSFKFAANNSGPSNNIIIDSGTTVTFIPSTLYEDLEASIKQKINSDKIVPDPDKNFGLCYSSLEGVQIPNVTIHFKGADLELNPINTFLGTSNSSICLAFVPTDEHILILGNVQQMNFWIEYDLEKKIVSFKPANCTAEE